MIVAVSERLFEQAQFVLLGQAEQRLRADEIGVRQQQTAVIIAGAQDMFGDERIDHEFRVEDRQKFFEREIRLIRAIRLHA